ncbi:hypothetical protein FF2_036958 [Malus domestica]
MVSTESGESYIGSLITLISKYEIRYEGVLYFLSVQDSSIGLKNVRAYGTEGRKKDGPQVPPTDTVYEYILFRATDIKDLQVKPPPSSQREERIHEDPAIIQSHYAGAPESSPPSALVGGKSLTETTHWQDTPALTSRGQHIGVLPSYHYGTDVGPSGNTSSTQLPSPPALSFPMYWQGYNGASLNMSDHPHNHIPLQSSSAISHPLTMQNKAPGNQSSTDIGMANGSECLTPVISSSAPTFVHPNFSASVTPATFSSLGMPSSLASQVPLPSHSTPLNASRLTMPLFPSPRQDLDISETQIVTKAVSDPVPVLPAQSMPYPGSFSVGSDLGPLLTPPPSLLTPDQLAPSRSHLVGALMPTSSSSISMIPPPATQAPLLPLPTSTQQSPYSTQFTEEFDFLAMNEKFKKDEVWGYLGQDKQRHSTERVDDSETSGTGQCLDEKEGGLVHNTKPAYNKDEFFDTISCSSVNRGGRNGHRFSERMKHDTETFGNFQQRSNLGYGGYASGRGGNYRGPYQWGRGYGYGYGGRGRGGNMPF